MNRPDSDAVWRFINTALSGDTVNPDDAREAAITLLRASWQDKTPNQVLGLRKPRPPKHDMTTQHLTTRGVALAEAVDAGQLDWREAADGAASNGKDHLLTFAGAAWYLDSITLTEAARLVEVELGTDVRTASGYVETLGDRCALLLTALRG